MEVQSWGTRGSLAVAGSGYIKFGGNTTCIQIRSDRLPANTALFVDAGTGFLPAGLQAVKDGITEVNVLFTHYHADHTQGFAMSPIIYNPPTRLRCFGPVEYRVNPRAAMDHLLKRPFFPVSLAQVGDRIDFDPGFDNPADQVFAIHPMGGLKIVPIDVFRRAEIVGSIEMPMGTWPIDQLMVVKMMFTDHPERTVCYRFEDRVSKKVFVFMTDNESQAGISAPLRAFISKADLLVLDCQYSDEEYQRSKAGYGHGTPSYCASLALLSEAKKIGLTHHDPLATDDKVIELLSDTTKKAQDLGHKGELVALADGDILYL